MKTWIYEQERDWIDKSKENFEKIDPEMLNEKQKLAYDYVIPWIDLKIANCKKKKKIKPLYLNVSGRGGSGKSLYLHCLRKYLSVKGITNFMKIGALTASAAFLVIGDTMHGMLKLPLNLSKNKELPKYKGDLHALQKEFETVELLVIDEKLMIGKFLF